jgi:hypothetical protein
MIKSPDVKDIQLSMFMDVGVLVGFCYRSTQPTISLSLEQVDPTARFACSNATRTVVF